MKKITLALVAVMLVLGMTQCKKEQPTPTPEPTPDGEVVYISMKVDDGGKYTIYPATGAYVFGTNDKIYVGNNGHYVGTLTYSSGTFSGSITNPSTEDYLHFYFTGNKAPTTLTTGTTNFTVDISDQSSKLPMLSYGRSTTKYSPNTKTYSCMLENQCGLVKFVPSIATSETIIISGMKTTATIDFATPGITPTNTTGDLTLYSAGTTAKWAILLPQDEVENPTVTISGYKYPSVTVPAVTPNMYNNTGVTITMPLQGTIGGLFTVNSSGKQVYFSYGNLQYIGSAATPYWKFADNQWDYLGTTTGQNNSATNKDRDLFGWGTSGYDHGATAFQPWSTSSTNTAYYAYGYSYKNLYDDTGQADWGYNAISNGGNQENSGWRSLTWLEWNYLLNYSPSKNRSNCCVNGVNGLVLLPDNWDYSYYSFQVAFGGAVGPVFTDNIISLNDWIEMEKRGAVFLPAAGDRSGTYVLNLGNKGLYWTANYEEDEPEYNGSNYLSIQNSRTDLYETYRYIGCSVRLVRDAQ